MPTLVIFPRFPFLIFIEKPLTTVNGADIHTTPVTSLRYVFEYENDAHFNRWKPRGSYGMNPQILMSTCADGNVSHWYAPTGNSEVRFHSLQFS